MARSYSQVTTAVWRDEDFRMLTPQAQHVYLMLVTQPEISPVGTLAITLRRWASNANGMTIEWLSNGLRELETAKYIVTDEDSEELLVRTFVRWDGGHTNPNRLRAIKATALSVSSPTLRAVLATELDKLGIEHSVRATPFEGHSDAIGRRSEGHSNDQGAHRPFEGHSNDAGLVVSSYVTEPQPENDQPKPQPRKNRSSNGESFDEFWQAYPRRVAKGAARKVWDRIVKNTPPELIIKGAQRYAADPSREERFTAHPATWLNAERWGDEPSGGSESGLQPIWNQ